MNSLKEHLFAKFGTTGKITLVVIAVSFFSCEPEVERPGDPGQLTFSTDTIFFDTLFTQTRSLTKRLKVYNQSGGAVNIEKLSVNNGSAFSLYIHGQKGKEFNDVQILGNDSLLVLVEAEIDKRDENTPFIIEDELQVISSKTYKIPLVAWGQDAVFLKDTVLICEARMTAEKPYVIFGAVVVDSLCTLSIDAGARIYSHFNAGIYVKGQINSNGDSENRVLFTNDRLDGNFKNAPGQWRGIYILEGSTGNSFQYTDIRNAEVGIRIGAPDDNDEFDLEIGHSKIENITTAGILSFTSDVFIYNSLINNCGYASFAGLAGGTYKLWHNTLANYSFDFFREDPTVILSNNIILSDNTLLTAPLHAELINNIIWGNMTDELLFSNHEGEPFILDIRNNLIRTTINTLNDSNILNKDPLFIKPREYQYQLDSLSPAINAGLALPDIQTDLEGKSRTTSPDLGAYEKH